MMNLSPLPRGVYFRSQAIGDRYYFHKPHPEIVALNKMKLYARLMVFIFETNRLVIHMIGTPGIFIFYQMGCEPL